MSKDIQCTCCRKPLGCIRDATLRKRVCHICHECNQRRLNLLVELQKAKGQDPLSKILDASSGNAFLDALYKRRN